MPAAWLSLKAVRVMNSRADMSSKFSSESQLPLAFPAKAWFSSLAKFSQLHLSLVGERGRSRDSRGLLFKLGIQFSGSFLFNVCVGG